MSIGLYKTEKFGNYFIEKHKYTEAGKFANKIDLFVKKKIHILNYEINNFFFNDHTTLGGGKCFRILAYFVSKFTIAIKNPWPVKSFE